jgi:hypothetical protein
MNSWTDTDRNFTDGKFGFLVQGSDEISVSDFKFTPQQPRRARATGHASGRAGSSKTREGGTPNLAKTGLKQLAPSPSPVRASGNGSALPVVFVGSAHPRRRGTTA